MCLLVTSNFLLFSDLKAFERRLTEVIASLQPATLRWRSMIFYLSVSVIFYKTLLLDDNVTLMLLIHFVTRCKFILCIFNVSLFSVLLGFISVCTAIGAWHWLTDPNTPAVSFTQSLCNHPFFAIASIILGKHDQHDLCCFW